MDGALLLLWLSFRWQRPSHLEKMATLEVGLYGIMASSSMVIMASLWYYGILLMSHTPKSPVISQSRAGNPWTMNKFLCGRPSPAQPLINFHFFDFTVHPISSLSWAIHAYFCIIIFIMFFVPLKPKEQSACVTIWLMLGWCHKRI